MYVILASVSVSMRIDNITLSSASGLTFCIPGEDNNDAYVYYQINASSVVPTLSSPPPQDIRPQHLPPLTPQPVHQPPPY